MLKKCLKPNQIIKLKANLMPKKQKNKSNSIGYSFLSSEYSKMYNKENGINFENNIRKIFEIFYGWKKSPLNRRIIYREIIYEEKSNM